MNCKTCFKETEIGLIPEEWNVKKLSDLAIITDSLHKTPNYVENGYPMVRVKDLKEGFLNINGALLVDSNVYNEFTRRCKPKKGDILVSRVGSYGIFSYINSNEIFCLGQNTALISSNINSLYLFYCLKSSIVKTQIEKTVVGSTQKTLSLKNINNILIPVCGPEKQSIIANFLYSLDSKIELNRQMNTTLEQMAQAIFKHWFIDFEFPDENGQPYRSSGGEMVDSELGEIPVGWEVKQIGNVCKIVGGGTPKTKEPSYWEDGDIFWATPTDMTSLKSPIIFDTSRKITNKGLENSSAKLLPINSILMTSRATLGYFAINKVPICTNQGFISMIRDEDISKYYLLNAVRNKMETIESLAGGSTYPEISKTVFKSIKIIVPLLRVMQKYETFCDFLYEKIYSNDLENINLSEFRDTLLPKLMSGKIRVKP
ncbi:MAG: Type I restriction modification DNA specificity domain-containing protein [Methanolobus sp. T82-4]|nr:MAG: Type I restriction modification DNA specificity domain-containing protein [Methanolobus sp. T82-4]